MRIIKIICIAMLMVSFSNISEAITPVINKDEHINKYIQYNSASYTIDKLKKLNNKERNNLVNYVKEHPQKVSPLLLLYFADDIFSTDKEKAVLLHTIGRIRSVEDAQMCIDKTAAGQVAVYSVLSKETLLYMRLRGNKYILEVFEEAIKWDLENSERVSPIWACFNGLDTSDKEPELKNKDEFPKIQKETHERLLNNLRKKVVQTK